MARILGVGIATLDIINTVDHYPQEDEEMRALSQRVSRGGNCANTLVALGQLGHVCNWAGVVSDEPDVRHILADLEEQRVDHDDCLVHPGGKVPTSYITLNRANGSRTIVHYRDLPELPYSHFETVDLNGYDWFHFEGRNIEETLLMMQRVRERMPLTPVSLEVEKPREGIEALFDQATVIIFSKAYAQARGYDDGEAFLREMHKVTPQSTTLYCAWGDEGGYGILKDGTPLHSPAFPPPELVDTIGAGDVFNAGIIHGELNDLARRDCLEQACRIAGDKCGVEGIELWNFTQL
jgi:ketohexokinase